jgi:two-component system chemotaxis response regulator CheY
VRIVATGAGAGYLDTLQSTLSRAGFQVSLTEAHPAAAERLAPGSALGMLLLDVGGAGDEATLPTPGLFTVIVIADDIGESTLRALHDGVDDYLATSTPASELVARLRSAARRLEMERKLRTENMKLHTLALTDELTGIANRRALLDTADEVSRHGRRLAVALFDLNGFKRINDTFGHPAGDRILADVAAAFKRYTRYGDIIGRYGGDEFVLLLPDAELSDARSAADRLQRSVEELRWNMHDTPVTMRVTYGIAAGGPGVSFTQLLAECDRRMYAGKSAGVDAPRTQQALRN